MTQKEKEFSNQCEELGHKIIDLLLTAEKSVAICVLPAVLASTMMAFNLPRELIISILDSALEDIQQQVGGDYLQ